MFNTDDQIDVFIPYSQNAMLAITNESAYKICAIQSDDGSCVESCDTEDTEDLYLDINGNFCGASCSAGNNYILIPEEVCISECDTSIYISNSTNHCGLCRDMYSDKKYKLINGTECLSSIPEGYEVYNENLGLLVCKSGYIFDNGNCVPHCYNTCGICTEYSTNENYQHCINCTEGYELENGVDSNCRKIVVYSECNEENKLKCSLCNEESNSVNLCINCSSGYKKVNYTTLNPEFFDCLKEDDPILKQEMQKQIIV